VINLKDILSEAEKRTPRKKGQKKKSSKHSDLFTDEDPKGTIHGLGFKDAKTASAGVAKINKAKRTHAHKVQATLVMKQRAKVAKERTKDPEKKKDLNAAFRVWSSHLEKLKAKTKKMNEMSATAKKHGKFGLTNVPFPTEEPNEFAYMDFVDYIKKNEKKMIKFLKPIRPDAMFKAMQDIWSGWDRKTNQGAFSNIRGNKFGRKLVLMLRNDGLLFSKDSNKITNLKEKSMKLKKIAEASNVWKIFDMKQKLQGNIIDLEMDMKMINKDLSQLYKDMEQEAEPEGGPKATMYGKAIEKKEKEYKKKKAEFNKLMAKLDRLEMF